jgi:SPASM domain peptide maturase of grasp-with-spasm system
MRGRRVFRLFACCVPVRGARRSTLCDLQRQSYRLVPNGMVDILTEHRDRTLDEIKAAFGPEDEATVEQYFHFLVENEFGFWTDDPDAFPPLDLSWDAPERITNAVIDVGPRSAHDFASLYRQLDGLGCKMLQLRFFAPVGEEALRAVLAPARAGRLRTIELLLPWTPEWTDARLGALCEAHPRVSAVYVHGAPEARRVEGPDEVRIALRTRAVTSAEHCGEVHPVYFTVNTRLFTEAQGHNTCLNRKLAVDEDGEIRNCPAHPRSFGNAAGTPLAAACLQDAFREPWTVSKDQVRTCRDCEFRYVCTDCRVFVADASDPFSKPAKCAYDPYTAGWGTPAPPAVHAAPAPPARAEAAPALQPAGA